MNPLENPASRVIPTPGTSKQVHLLKGQSIVNASQLKASVKIKYLPCKGLKAPNISAVQPKINWLMKTNQLVFVNTDQIKSSKSNVPAPVSPLAISTDETSIDCEIPQVKVNFRKYKLDSKPQMRIINHEIKRHGYASSIDEESDGFISPSMRWNAQPKSYKGARKGNSMIRNAFVLAAQNFDTTDGETSGMGSSVDEPLESSTESASEASIPFFPPRTSPQTVKKRRGGWPKGRKRKPETLSSKYPKQPVTAYILYLNERRKYYKETCPNLPTVEVTKMLGAEWSNLSAEQKEEYIQRSEQDRRRYRNEMQAFRQSSDYQVCQQIARKKRAKNASRKGQNSNEESSDFTDEIDDEDEYDLYCKTCDQHFSSMHNKREHMYGRHHLQAMTGKIEKGKQMMSKRRKRDIPSTMVGSPRFKSLYERPTSTDYTSASSSRAIVADSDDDYLVSTEGESTVKDESMSWRESAGVISTTEDDHDYEDDDEENNDFNDKDSVITCHKRSFSDPSHNAFQDLFGNCQSREKKLGLLNLDEEEVRMHHANLSQELRELEKRQKQLQEEQRKIKQKEKEIKQQFQYLSNPKLFVTPVSQMEPISSQNGQLSTVVPFCNQSQSIQPSIQVIQPCTTEYKETYTEPMTTNSQSGNDLFGHHCFKSFTDNVIYTIVEPREEDTIDPANNKPGTSEQFSYTNHDPNLGAPLDANQRDACELEDLFIEDGLNIFSERVLEDAESAYNFADPFS